MTADDDAQWADAHLANVDQPRPLPAQLASQIEGELGGRPGRGDTESAGARLAVLGLVASAVIGLGAWITVSQGQSTTTALRTDAVASATNADAIDAAADSEGSVDVPAANPDLAADPATSIGEACERFRATAYQGIDRGDLLITTGVASFLDDPRISDPALVALHGALEQLTSDARAVDAPSDLTDAAARAEQRAGVALANHQAGSSAAVVLGQVVRQLELVDQVALGLGVVRCS